MHQFPQVQNVSHLNTECPPISDSTTEITNSSSKEVSPTLCSSPPPHSTTTTTTSSNVGYILIVIFGLILSKVKLRTIEIHIF